MMRFSFKNGLLLLLISLMAISSAGAQKAQERSDRTYSVTSHSLRQARPLNLDEGLSILTVALDSRHHAAFRSDCSHFVHGLYERAGFPYAYAPSSDLYAGIDGFRRVTNPQPGDLAVWRGHAGIVVNPVQHSFFSLLRSGPGVDSYDSPYWKRKGRPRFFRYVKAAPGSLLAGSTSNVSLRPTAFEDDESRSSEKPASATPADRTSENTLSSQRVANPPSNVSIAPLVVVNSIHPKPDQVANAFLRACTDSEPNFRGRDLSKSTQPLIVFDRFTVKKVHISGTQAWADVQIDELASITGGQSQARTRSERQRWPLIRRDRTGWELVLPRDTVYLPQPIAVRLLAQQLARLTEDTSATSRSQEKTELAQLLNVLLQK
jgi:hypothetical protein